MSTFRFQAMKKPRSHSANVNTRGAWKLRDFCLKYVCTVFKVDVYVLCAFFHFAAARNCPTLILTIIKEDPSKFAIVSQFLY